MDDHSKEVLEWRVVDVKAFEDYTMEITFIGGEHRIFDARYLLDIEVFRPLRNIGFFQLAHASRSTVVWNDDIDIAPEVLYEKSIPMCY